MFLNAGNSFPPLREGFLPYPQLSHHRVAAATKQQIKITHRGEGTLLTTLTNRGSGQALACGPIVKRAIWDVDSCHGDDKSTYEGKEKTHKI